MVGNYTEITCPNCKRIIRSTDKFCIFCGSKIVTDNASSPQPAKPAIPEKEKKELEKEVDKELNIQNLGTESKSKTPASKAGNVPFVPTSAISEDIGTTKDTEKGKKKAEKTPTNLELTLDMPIEIRDALEAKLNLAVIENKKKILKKKLTELQKSLEDERYENDYEFANQVNTTLDALKSVKEELGKEDDKWRKQLGDRFIMDKLEDTLEEKRQQLIELQRSFKLHNIKKDVYEQLKQEYVSKFTEAEKELTDLRLNIVRWLSKEKADKNKLETKIRMAQGRLKSGELDNENFQTLKTDTQKDIDKIDQRILILEMYSKEKQKRMF